MLDLHLDLILITFVSFIVLIFALNRLLYRPLIAFMDKRETLIADDMKNAKRNIEAIESAGNQSNDILKKARDEAQEIKQNAIKEATETQTNEINALKDKLETEYSQFIENLNNQKQDYKKELLAKIPAISDHLKNKLSQLA